MTVEEIKKKIAPILSRSGALRAAVFGSVARGNDTAESDVDMLIDIPRPYGLFKFLSIKNDMEDILGRKVDLIAYGAVKPSMRTEVLQSAVEIL